MSLAPPEAQPVRTAGPAVYDPVAIARGLRPLLAQHAAQCEQDRRVPDVVIDAIQVSGLFGMMWPRRAGGPGCTLITHIETIAELAKGCAGTAWAFGLLSGITGTVRGMPSELTKHIFVRGDEMFCSASSMTGVATPAEGGYRVTGSWGYGSGCLHAAWAMNGITRLDTAGNVADAGWVLFPLGQPGVTIEDTWHVAGVQGSGSNTIVAQDIFVPRHFIFWRSAAPDPMAVYSMPGAEPRDYWPMEPLFPLVVLPPMLGAAGAMLELVAAAMPNRAIVGWTYPKQSESQILAGQLGEAAMEIDSAWLHIRRAAGQVDEISPIRPLSGYEMAMLQADCGYAMSLLRSAAQRLMDIAGPSAFADSSPLQRFWRDVNFGSRHNALNTRLSLELYGRALLDQPSNLLLLPDIRRAGN